MFLLFCLMLQDLDPQRPVSWVTLARPWMTVEETALYDSLDPIQQERFRGWFVARRLQEPDRWPETGTHLPEFFCAKPHGDIRDQIIHALGEPEKIEPMVQSPTLPGRLIYPDHSFGLVPEGGGKVALAPSSRAEWDKVLESRIRHPELKYDFSRNGFGRTRLPETMTWQDVTLDHLWWTPETDGGLVRMTLEVPETWRLKVMDESNRRELSMELLVQLYGPGQSEPIEEPWHAATPFEVGEDRRLHFRLHLPAGAYDAELMVYSGYHQTGLKTRTSISIRPDSLPRVSDPILSQTYVASGIDAAPIDRIDTGGFSYKPSKRYRAGLGARVLVNSPFEDTQLRIQKALEQPKALERVARDGDWFVFNLPPQKEPFRLISLGFPNLGATVALGAWGESFGTKDLTGFAQNGATNYLSLEGLEIDQDAPLSLLFVNGEALAASKDGTYPWPAQDWGELADLRFEYARAGAWRFAPYQIRRNAVFQRVRVKPRFLVAGTRSERGLIREEPLEVTVLDQPVEVVRRTPLRKVPKLWGVVVNDPMLRTPAWPRVRDRLLGWLKEFSGEGDLVYLVQNAERPELVVAPTSVKATFEAALEALEPRSPQESWFSAPYLIEALTHLREHETMPHQVIFLTDRLTDQTSQMEELLLGLRGTGLQVYNLELPYLEPPRPEETLAAQKMSNYDRMKTEAEEDTEYRQAMRDDFMEKRGTPSLLSFRFGGKKRRESTREEAIRLEAFYNAFNTQLGTLTAGMGMVVEKGEISDATARFFDAMSRWQDCLVHLELNVPFIEPDMVEVRGEGGAVASWTLVEWKPKM